MIDVEPAPTVDDLERLRGPLTGYCYRMLGAADPAGQLVERESVRLAFIAVLQRLAPKQRAALVLRDVLAFSAAETAEILDSTVASVNSALQRGRAEPDRDRPDPAEVFDPRDADQRRLVQRYIAAFEAHDVGRLQDLLGEDARSSMPPFAWWISGASRVADQRFAEFGLPESPQR